MSSTPFAMSASTREKDSLTHSKKRAVVVDDSPTILHAICSLLEHHEVVDVVGRAESGPETIDIVAELRPELVLMDADMPGMSGLRAALLLSQNSPATRVVLMSMDMTPQFYKACSGCGAHAVIYKPKFLNELAKVLQQEPGKDWEKPPLRIRRRLTARAAL